MLSYLLLLLISQVNSRSLYPSRLIPVTHIRNPSPQHFCSNYPFVDSCSSRDIQHVQYTHGRTSCINALPTEPMKNKGNPEHKMPALGVNCLTESNLAWPSQPMGTVLHTSSLTPSELMCPGGALYWQGCLYTLVGKLFSNILVYALQYVHTPKEITHAKSRYTPIHPQN